MDKKLDLKPYDSDLIMAAVTAQWMIQDLLDGYPLQPPRLHLLNQTIKNAVKSSRVPAKEVK